ncbi:MAG: cupin domain-containing protein [Chloroflexi bacterium]|nr:MAG: cupin domain-containing protein [Chloroflexota bacterium]TMD73297.1 MAG: cupin domain-containing protein [Chloroflexota bacterium]
MAIRFFRSDDLPRDVISRDFVGEKHGGIGACVLFVDAGPGEGPRLHRHPYVEILIVLEGTSTFDDGQSKRIVEAGEMAVVEAGQAHAFTNSGLGRLRQIDIHLAPAFATEWLA